MNDVTRQQVEAFSRLHMEGGEVAHGYLHAHRVRVHALAIAQGEGYPHQAWVEAAALLHDIGLKHVAVRREHGAKGAEMAALFLSRHGLFNDDAIVEIAHAIRLHDSVKKDASPLLAIVRDADMLDLFGALGVVRATQTRADAPEYDVADFPASTWGDTSTDFDARFASGLGTGPTVLDQIAFHLSCAANLNTATARRMAEPRLAWMRRFAEVLIAEAGEFQTQEYG